MKHPFQAPDGKPSMMRTAAIIAVVSGCFPVVMGTLGFAGAAGYADHGLALAFMGLTGKVLQRFTEKQPEKPPEA